LDGGDAEMLVAVGEMGSSGGDAGLGVTGDGGVAIEDEVAVGGDAGGIDLGYGKLGCYERCKKESKHGGALQKRATGRTCGRNTKNGRRKN